jgi:glycosyltransferase 2 family protein
MTGFLRRVIVSMLLGVAVYGVFVAITGFSKIQSSLTQFHWSAFAIALGMASGNYALRVLKWEYYLARLGIRGIPKFDSALIFLSGFVLTVTPGKVGEIFKSAVLFRTHNVSVARTAPIVVAERLTDLVGIIILIVLGSLGFSGGLGWAITGAVLVIVGLVFVLWQKPLQLVIAWMEHKPGKLRQWAPKAREAVDSLRVLASPGALLWPSLLSIVAWAFEGLALYYLLVGFGVKAPVPLVVFFYSTATLAGAVIPVPGGLGISEAMIQQQLVHLGGVVPGVATASMLLVRFATLWWAVLVGFIALFILRTRYPSLSLRDKDVGANAPQAKPGEA